MTNGGQQIFIFRSFVNSFQYLYRDAEYLQSLAKRPEIAESFGRTQISRTALLLYILSLEGLINRALDYFLPEKYHDFVIEREEKFSIEDKYLLLPLLFSPDLSIQFDKSRYPWSHFSELVRLRNDFVHPKHDRPSYTRAITSHRWEPLSWKEIPSDSKITESDIVYRQTRIPKDPYAILSEHVDIAKKIVDDTVAELNRLLGGKIFQDNWHTTDKMELIYPPGATLNNLPRDPNPPKLKT